MRDDIGMDGIRRVLGSVGIGHFWDDTYREASGKSWSGSLGTFADRLKGSAPRYPGVAFARDTPDGPGVSYVVYGFAADTTVRVRITSAGWARTGRPGPTRSARPDGTGAFRATLGT